MKKWRILFFLLALALLFTGCRPSPKAQCRYTTRVEITCDYEGGTIRRSYTQEDKMGAVLLYLRLLKKEGPPDIDPNTLPSEVFQITVFLSDGSSRSYTQYGHRYIKDGLSGWRRIPADQAINLHRLFAHFDSDL